jgi:hypothetical protein
MNMKIIAIVESDDTGPVAILDPDLISIVSMQDLYLAATRDPYTERPITCEISAQDAAIFMSRGVKCLTLE